MELMIAQVNNAQTMVLARGSDGITIIIIGNGFGEASSNQRQGCFHFEIMPLGKAWIHLFLLEQTEHFHTLTGPGVARLKIDLMSHTARWEEVR